MSVDLWWSNWYRPKTIDRKSSFDEIEEYLLSPTLNTAHLRHWVGEIDTYDQFHQHLHMSAFAPIFLCQKSLSLKCKYKKALYKKGARKMLVKLTLDGLRKKVKLKLKKEFCVREVEKWFLQKRWRWILRKKSPFFHPLCFKTLKGNVFVVVVRMADEFFSHWQKHNFLLQSNLS